MNFITGHNFKKLSHYILDENGFRLNKPPENNIPIYFVKTDYIHQFFNSVILPNFPFFLITHNSDYSIDITHSQYLQYEYLKKWFGQNINYKHEKLIPIPIGIANPEWPHGNIDTILEVINSKYSKNQIMYANFNLHTNPRQRGNCLRHIKQEFIENNVSFDMYLKKIAQSYFNICPLGNGIDSHRIWESLYLKTIPIAENTYNISYMKKRYNLPIILVNDWSELQRIELNENKYLEIINNFNPSILNTSEFLQ